MKLRLKAIKDQVIVITGASSGIGLATARMAAKKGARLVLAARNEEALRQLADEIQQNGGEATYVVADVGDEERVYHIARVAQERFGGFDTWVNNAGIGIYGRTLDGTTEDHRRLFDTNFWGVVYGSTAAVPCLAERGGALINVGSTVSDRTVFLQGMYSASKHAVKGYTDSLRMEVEQAGMPISVTLIQPGSIDTPFPNHARNYMDEEPSLPPPVYAPEAVAEAILHCAEHPTRNLFVGSGGKGISALGQHAPRLADKAMESDAFIRMQKSGQPPRPEDDALYAPTTGLQERGNYAGHVKPTSMYTQAKMHPLVMGALLGVTGLALTALYTNRTHANGTH
jgi:short-subunit dehydrogenase